MKTWTTSEICVYVLKLCSEFSGRQFPDEKTMRALVAYKVLQFFCRKGFNPGPIAPRTIQTIASDLYAAMKKSGYVIYSRTLVSQADIVTFKPSSSTDPSVLEQCYKGIRRKPKDIDNDTDDTLQ